MAKQYIIFTDFVGPVFSVKNFEFWKIRYFDLFSIFQNNLYKTCLNLTLIDDELLPDILPLNSNQFWQFPITRLGVAVRQRGGLLIILPLKTLHYRPLTQKRSRQPPIFFLVKINVTQSAKKYIIFTYFFGAAFSIKKTLNFEKFDIWNYFRFSKITRTKLV